MRDSWCDVRLALRLIRKAPGFSLLVVLTLGLGIGANCAIFNVVYTVLLRPLPYRHVDRLVVAWEGNLRGGSSRSAVSPSNFIEWQRRNRSFDKMAAMVPSSFNLTGSQEPERIEGARVSADYFPLLGIDPLVGRPFVHQEDLFGAERVVLLSEELWRRRFAANPGIVGSSLILNGKGYTVIGVVPRHFQYGTKAELWTLLAFGAEEAREPGHYLLVLGRLRPGISLERARTEMRIVAAQLAQHRPKPNADWTVEIYPLREEALGPARKPLLLLLGTVGLVLIIACANVANLLFARAAERQREVAVRAAVGATRLRLTRQLMIENLLLAGLGGILGLLLAWAGTDGLVTLNPQDLPRINEIGANVWVVLFALALTLGTSVLFGLAPSLHASKLDLNKNLKEAGATGSRSRQRLRALLVVAQICLALALVVSAGLMIRSFQGLRRVDLGFNPDNLLTLRINLPSSKYPKQPQQSVFFEDLLARIRAIPGVRSVAAATTLPLTGNQYFLSFSILGRPRSAEDGEERVSYDAVSTDYFRVLGVSLREGRSFEAADREGGEGVVIINEAMARRYWPDGRATGERLRIGDSGPDSRVIVGVVRDVKHVGFRSTPDPKAYVPYRQRPWQGLSFAIRTAAEPSSVLPVVRRAVWELDKEQTISQIFTMQELVARSMAQVRFTMWLLVLSSAFALVLACIGVYALISYSVSQRSREIGLRLALGARARQIFVMILGGGLALALTGLVFGLVLTLFVTRLLSAQLFEVSATDPETFSVGALLLVLVALLASYLPARRAVRIDPMAALREE